jgi:hypothetical protein
MNDLTALLVTPLGKGFLKIPVLLFGFLWKYCDPIVCGDEC